MICESSRVCEVEGEVKVLECLGPSSAESRDRESVRVWTLDSGAKPPKADNKAASKRLA